MIISFPPIILPLLWPPTHYLGWKGFKGILFIIVCVCTCACSYTCITCMTFFIHDMICVEVRGQLLNVAFFILLWVLEIQRRSSVLWSRHLFSILLDKPSPLNFLLCLTWNLVAFCIVPDAAVSEFSQSLLFYFSSALKQYRACF